MAKKSCQYSTLNKNNRKYPIHTAHIIWKSPHAEVTDSEFKATQLRSSTRAFSHSYSETSRETLVLPSNMFLFRDCDYILYYLAMDSGTQLFDLLFCSDKEFLFAFNTSVWAKRNMKGDSHCSVFDPGTGLQRAQKSRQATEKKSAINVTYQQWETRRPKRRGPHLLPLHLNSLVLSFTQATFFPSLFSSCLLKSFFLPLFLCLCLSGFRKTAICCNWRLLACSQGRKENVMFLILSTKSLIHSHDPLSSSFFSVFRSSLSISLSPELWRILSITVVTLWLWEGLWLRSLSCPTSLSVRDHVGPKRISLLVSPHTNCDAEAGLVNCIWQLQIAQPCSGHYGWENRRWKGYMTKGKKFSSPIQSSLGGNCRAIIIY